jgi:hypothetical protein
MSDQFKNSSYGTPDAGPFQDNTVQTYFRISPPHTSPQSGYHVDFELVKPAVPRDEVRTIDHIKLP